LAATLRDVRPTAFLGVPSVWEAMQEKIVSTMRTEPLYKRLLVQWARSVGLRGNTSLMNGYELVICNILPVLRTGCEFLQLGSELINIHEPQQPICDGKSYLDAH